MTRVLILTASYGSGHNAAARSLGDAFKRADRRHRSWIIFAISCTHSSIARAGRSTTDAPARALPVGRRARARRPDGQRLLLTFRVTRLGTRRLACCSTGSRRTSSSRFTRPLPPRCRRWPGWDPGAAAHDGRHDFVAHSHRIVSSRRPLLRRRGRGASRVHRARHSEERIVVTGVPVRAEFAEPVDPAAARAALGLSSEMPVGPRDGRVSTGARPSPRRRAGAPGSASAAPGARRRRSRRAPARRARASDRRHTDPHAGIRRGRAPAHGRGGPARDQGRGDDARRGDGGRHAAPPLRLAARPGAAQRALRGAGRDRARRAQAGSWTSLFEHALREPDLLEHLRARMRHVRRPDATRRIVEAVLEGGVRAMIRPLAVGAAAVWAAYTWGAHPDTPSPSVGPGFVRRGPATGRRIALTFDDGPDPYWTSRVLEVLGAPVGARHVLPGR